MLDSSDTINAPRVIVGKSADNGGTTISKPDKNQPYLTLINDSLLSSV